ncbi:hypothetical protein LAUMK4_04165 [Mycobacterium persicum]|uniref:Uncharacterized protein n=1 Tax=Mycobacterium persicum TaxID=1487726 RepID=A0AB38UY76_9MYCO|nr:hypothetical protein LAUMK22_04068 [Mycobacterium kansasii]VAZ78825.1 hypothetical protein LAUMK15_04572 [Mycobacterium persicum]VAZ85404.1 hypothetical protein LAUMK42_04238 [Mycobacterium persicum]VAZ98260.1 hypothetical protein LAUMK4_04165 [Mycobacterium persicum]
MVQSIDILTRQVTSGGGNVLRAGPATLPAKRFGCSWLGRHRPIT